MSTATKSSQYVEFDEYIDFQLQKTRQSMKVTDIATAVCGISVAVLAYLLVFAVCDHWLIPGGFGYFWRVALLAGLVVGTCLWVGIRVVMPSLRRINQLYAAKAIEGVSPELQSNLINWVDLRHAGREVSPLILRSIEKRAAVSLSHADVEEAVDRQTLLKVLYALVAVVFLFAAYVVISPKKVGPSIWRALMPTSDVQVATRTQIEKVDPPGTEVPAGSVLEVTADLLGDVPPQVVLKYSTADRRVVDRAVEMRLLEDGLKRYRCVLDGEKGEGLLQDLDFWIEAGDAQSPSYHVTVIQPPSATITEVAYDFPKYTLKERETQPNANIDTFEGSTVTITATTNMPVKSAVLQFSDDDKFASKGEEKVVRVSDGTRLSVDWKAEFRSDGSFPKFYRVQVRTESGLSDPSPAVNSILLRRDVPPEIELVAPKVNMSLFANAIVPIVVKARDPDFLLRDVQLFAMKKEQQIFDKVLGEQRVSDTEVRFDWRLADLDLKAGDEVTMYVAARDNKEPFSNRKESQRRVITIIEPGTQKQVDEQLAKDKQKIDEIQQTDQPNDGKRDENDPGAENPNANPKPSTDPRDNEKTDPNKQPRDDKQDKQRQPQDAKGNEDGDPSSDKTSPSNSGKKNNSNQSDSDDNEKNDPKQDPMSDPNAKKEGRRNGQPQDNADSNNEKSKDGSNGERRPLKNDGQDDADALKKAIERLRQKQGEKQPDSNKQDGSQEKKSSDGANDNADKPEAPKNDGSNNDNKTEQKKGNDSATKPEGTKPDATKPEKPSATENKDDAQKPGDPMKTEPKTDPTKNDSTDKKNDGTKSPDKQPMPGQTEKKQPQDGDASKNDASKPMTDPKSNDASKTNETNETKGKDDSKDKADSPSKDPGQSSDNSDKANGSKTQPMSKEPMPKTGNNSNDPMPKDDKQPSNAKSQDPMNGEKTNDSKTESRPSKEPMPKEPSKNGANNNDSKNSDATNSKSPKKEGTDESKPPKDSGSTSAADCPDPKDGDGASKNKPSSNGKQPSNSSDKMKDDGKSSDEKSEDKSAAGKKNDNSKGPPKGGKQDDEPKPSGNEKDDAQQDNADGKKGKPDPKSKDPMKGNEAKNEGDDKEGPQEPSNKSDKGPKGGKSDSKQEGKEGGESEAKSGTKPQKPKDGGDPTKGVPPGKLQSRDGNSDGSKSGDAGETDANPDPVNLDDKKKATNLVLKRLKDELERGEVDQEFLKELGWTEADLKRFVDRLDQQSKSGADTPAEQARRRQFEEMLKSLDLRSTGGARQDATKTKRSTSDFTDKQAPVPLEYRDAYKKYAEKLSKQKKADPK